jgi:hypothetical protein
MRKDDADRPSPPQVKVSQRTAIIAWSKVTGERYAELANIGQLTLVVNGNNDVMIPTINSYTLSQRIPRAQLIVYPDSGHGALFQYPELFCCPRNDVSGRCQLITTNRKDGHIQPQAPPCPLSSEGRFGSILLALCSANRLVQARRRHRPPRPSRDRRASRAKSSTNQGRPPMRSPRT